eukprot:tig00020807_g14076.t1
MSADAGSSSGERAEKRARVEAPAPAEPRALKGAAPFDALPDAVMSCVFEELGLRASWTLRGVCRRWRRVIEETEWESFELDAGEAFVESCSCSHDELDGAMSLYANGLDVDDRHTSWAAKLPFLFLKRKLRLGAGASVSLRLRLSQEGSEEAAGRNVLKDAAAFTLLLAICGRARPAAVSFEFLGDGRGEGGGLEQPTGDLGGQAEGASFRIHLLHLLRTLGRSLPSLESLRVGFRWGHEFGGTDDELADLYEEFPAGRAPWPPAGELREALGPLGGLRSLTLAFDEPLMALSPEAAAAVAGACPLLRSVAVSLRRSREAADGVLAELARLAHLERLALQFPIGPGGCFEPRGGFAALADGAAGRSLRSIALVQNSALLTEGEAELAGGGELAAADGHGVSVRADEATFLALARMPRLESFHTLQISDNEVEGGAVLALRGAAALREASLLVSAGYEDDERTLGVARALAAALAALPRLEALRLKWDVFAVSPGCFDEATSEGAVAVLESPGARRALVDLELSFRPYAPGAARTLGEALSGLTRLATLKLDFTDITFGPGEDDAHALFGAADVVAVLASAGARRALTELGLHLGRALEAEEAEAVAALPPSAASASGPTPRTPRPSRPTRSILQARLGPGVAVGVELCGPPAMHAGREGLEAAGAIGDMFAGRECSSPLHW